MTSRREQTNILVLAGTIVLCATLGLLTVAHPLLFIAVLAMVVGALWVAAPIAWAVAISVFISAAAYRGIFLTLRIDLPFAPLSIYDGIWLATGVALLFHPRVYRGRSLNQATFLLGVAALVTVVLGLIHNQPLYSVVKLGRAQAFLVLGLITASYLPFHRHRLLLKSFVLGGCVTALLQILTFAFATYGIRLWVLLNIATLNNNLRVDASASNTAAYRDNGVFINFAVIAFLILLGCILTRHSLFSPHTMHLLVALLVVGILLSLTRSAWLATLGGTAVALIASRKAANNSGRPIIKAAILSSALLLALLLGSRFADISIVDERLATLSSGLGDLTLRDRISESTSALHLSGSQWWLGIGAVEVEVPESATGLAETRDQLHNGYVQYLVSGGLLALGALLFLLWTSVKSANTLLSNDRVFGKFCGVTSAATIAAIVLITTTGGVFNDAFQTAPLGVLLGLFICQTGSPQNAESTQ